MATPSLYIRKYEDLNTFKLQYYSFKRFSFSLQVIFEANSGSGFYGDIALDDIELHDYSCHSTYRKMCSYYKRQSPVNTDAYCRRYNLTLFFFL